MNTLSDGGPAFPHEAFAPEWTGAHGMTLRDYFAAAALQGLLSNDVVLRAFEATAERNGETTYALAARNAYHHADAMLKARSR